MTSSLDESLPIFTKDTVRRMVKVLFDSELG